MCLLVFICSALTVILSPVNAEAQDMIVVTGKIVKASDGTPFSTDGSIEILAYDNIIRAQDEYKNLLKEFEENEKCQPSITQYNNPNADGSYEVSVADNGAILFVHYFNKPVLQLVKGRKTINVKLDDISRMDNVVVYKTNSHTIVPSLSSVQTDALVLVEQRISLDELKDLEEEARLFESMGIDLDVSDFAKHKLVSQLTSLKWNISNLLNSHRKSVLSIPDVVEEEKDERHSNKSGKKTSKNRKINSMNLEDDANLGVEIQDYVEAVEEKAEEEAIPFQLVEEKPSFNGGTPNEFTKWFASKAKFPKDLVSDAHVKIVFTIDKNGDLLVNNITGADSLLHQDILNILSTSPKWKPASQRDRTVATSFNFDVFYLASVKQNKLTKDEIAMLHEKFASLNAYDKLRNLCATFNGVDQMKTTMFDRQNDSELFVLEDEFVQLDENRASYNEFRNKIDDCRHKINVCEKLGLSVENLRKQLVELETAFNEEDRSGLKVIYAPLTCYDVAIHYLRNCDTEGYFKSKAMMYHFINSFFK